MDVATVKELFRTHDADRSGTLDLDEFVELVRTTHRTAPRRI